MSATPNIMGASRSHETLREVLASRNPCKVLDAAAGQGALSAYLRDLGWEVHSADIFPEGFKVPDLSIQKVNLNHPLPYDDGSFDAVVCANAIHRLFNPAGAIREFYRVMRPSGSLYLNFNNYASIETRVRFLLFGSIEIREVEQGVNESTEPEGDVRIRIMYPQLAQYVESAGFEIIAVRPAPPRIERRWLSLVAAAVSSISRFVSADKRRENRLDVVNSPAILNFGHYALLEAVRR